MGGKGIMSRERGRMRAFIALEISERFADDLAAMARGVAAAVPGRFIPRENYHVTLVFLGEIGEAASRDAIAAIDAACPPQGIELVPAGLGTFGHPRDATLWLGIERSDELAALAGTLRVELDARGVPYDAKPFRPHITIARRARLERGQLPSLIFPERDRAPRLTLFRSILTSSGAVYKPLYTRELAGENAD